MNEQIKINQEWVAPLMAGRIMRRIRILAPHPDGGWIYKEGLINREAVQCPIRHMQQFQIHKVFRLEIDVCEHKHTKDFYESISEFPTHYKCTDCGDLFPTIGDTNLWFPKALKESD